MRKISKLTQNGNSYVVLRFYTKCLALAEAKAVAALGRPIAMSSTIHAVDGLY